MYHYITMEMTGTELYKVRSETYRISMLVVLQEKSVILDEPLEESTEKPMLEVDDTGEDAKFGNFQ